MDDVNIGAKYGENLDIKIANAEKIMHEGGFEFKEWVKSGDKGVKEMGTNVSKALGVYWDTEKDEIIYKVRINFGKKIRGRRNKQDSTLATIDADFPKIFTKRLALKLTHSVYDPANLVQPFYFKA